MDVVLLAVVWRLRYKLSLRDVAEMFLARGFTFTHEAIRDWEARFAPLIMISDSWLTVGSRSPECFSQSSKPSRIDWFAN
jgi:transposase-like protein